MEGQSVVFEPGALAVNDWEHEAEEGADKLPLTAWLQVDNIALPGVLFHVVTLPATAALKLISRKDKL